MHSAVYRAYAATCYATISVCPSQAGVLSKWIELILGSLGLHYEGATDGQFQEHLCQFLSMPQYTLSELSADFGLNYFSIVEIFGHTVHAVG